MSGIQKSICTIGIVIALIPFLGFPSFAESFLIVVGGMLVCGLTLVSTKHKQTFGEKVFEGIGSVASRVFVENRPQSSE
ncbi:MAG: hypothetical protein RJA61_294 [Candidatus Parcubacteria bacterium]